MKKGGINALEVVTDQITRLKQRLQATPYPHEKELLRKRIRNLERVLDFLAGSYSEPPPAETFAHPPKKATRQLHHGSAAA